MKNLYFLLYLFVAGCSPKQQEVTQVVETKEVVSTGASEWDCDKCAASVYAESEPDTAFTFSNGSKLLICGYPELREGRKIFSEFVLSECGKDSIIDFWSAVEEYEIRFEQDTLQLQKLELLALGNNQELVKEKWHTEYFYYENGKLEREKRLNSEIKYSQDQIDQSLQEFESTHWQKQNGASVEYTEMKMANSLMIAAASGSNKAEVYFKEFKNKFQPDGAYLEWYQQMADLLESTKK